MIVDRADFSLAHRVYGLCWAKAYIVMGLSYQVGSHKCEGPRRDPIYIGSHRIEPLTGLLAGLPII